MALIAWALALAAGRAAVASDACREACAAPVLAPPEPALLSSVHLTWEDPYRAQARRYEIARRPLGRAAAWTPAASVPADRPPHADDRGSAGAGLAPGEYEYRLRALHRLAAREAWSGWSAPQAVSVRTACAEAGGELAGLPRVLAEDRDHDGRMTGVDLARALAECAARGGCTLELLPVVYDDVAILIHDGDPAVCPSERTACLALELPEGLAIEGHGSASVLRSPAPRGSALPAPVLELRRRPDLRIQLRHLTLAGWSAPASASPATAAGGVAAIVVGNAGSAAPRPTRGGCIHDLHVRDFAGGAIALDHVKTWNLERNRFDGSGIRVGAESHDVLLRENRISRTAGSAIALDPGTEGALPSIRRPRVLGNEIRASGPDALLLSGIADGRIEENLIAATRDSGTGTGAALACRGAADRTSLLGNRIEDSGGVAIHWQCAGLGNTIGATRISGSCRERGAHTGCEGSDARCAASPDLFVSGTASGALVLVDDEVADSRCTAPLGAWPARPGLELLIRGGRYAAGPTASGPMRFESLDVVVERATAFRGAGLAFGRAARGVVAPSVAVSDAREPFQSDRSAKVLICPTQVQACDRLCSRKAPPGWCASAPAAAASP